MKSFSENNCSLSWSKGVVPVNKVNCEAREGSPGWARIHLYKKSCHSEELATWLSPKGNRTHTLPICLADDA